MSVIKSANIDETNAKWLVDHPELSFTGFINMLIKEYRLKYDYDRAMFESGQWDKHVDGDDQNG